MAVPHQLLCVKHMYICYRGLIIIFMHKKIYFCMQTYVKEVAVILVAVCRRVDIVREVNPALVRKSSR
jgi:hypothetical protein